MAKKTHSMPDRNNPRRIWTHCGKPIYNIQYEEREIPNLRNAVYWYQKYENVEVSRERNNILLAEPGKEPTCKNCRKNTGLDSNDKSMDISTLRTELLEDGAILSEEDMILLDLMEASGKRVRKAWLPPEGSYRENKIYATKDGAEYPAKGTVRCLVGLIFECKPKED